MNEFKSESRRDFVAKSMRVLACAVPVVSGVAMAGEGKGKGHGEGKNEKHPQIHKALHDLKQAKEDLEKAVHDYGGHRANAIKLIEQAEKELHEGLKYDEEHEGKGKGKGKKKDS